MHDIRLYRLTVVALLLAGCGGGSGGTGTTPPQTGSLTITITAPQAAAPPTVTVTGPAGFQHTLGATATLTGLTPGSYTIQAAPLSGGGPIVTTPFTDTITGSPATVSANATATAAVTYKTRAASGGLWVMNVDINLSELTAAQLGSSTSAAPAASMGTVGTHYLAMAFDTAGNLWAPDISASTVVKYTAAQLTAVGNPTPTVTLSAPRGTSPAPCGIAFDLQGNLWIANSASNTVVAYTPSQLENSGSPTPAVTLSATKGSLLFPCALAFDRAGNLWVGNEAGTNVVEYGASQLTASGSPTPAVTLSSGAPLSLAFDSTGDLWVGLNNFGIAEYSPAQLAVSGAPTPIKSIFSGGTLNEPDGLAFDNSGDLWVVNNGASTVEEFTPSQLAAGGALTATVTVSGTAIGNPVALAFNPHATNLPLRP